MKNLINLSGCLCFLCECCCVNFQEKQEGAAAICFCIVCCFAGYHENISGHKKRTYRFLNIILVLILSIVAVVLTSIIHVTNSSSTSQMKNIFENWQQGALLDILISGQCPINYEILSVYELPGTQLGCVCTEDKEIFTSECSDWQEFTGCYNLKPKIPIILDKWVQPSNNTYQAIQICGRRSQLKFYDLLENKTITEKDCNNKGYKVCQTQNPDNFYCVFQNESCPVRDFKISQNQLSDYEQGLNNYSLIYDQGFYAYTSHSAEITPLVNIAITKGKGICFDDSKISLNPKLDQDYILLSPSPENCEIDNTYLQVAKTTENAFFSLNSIQNLIQSERPLYEIKNTIEYQLLAQNQIYYKIDCRRDNFQEIINLGERFNTQSILITCQLVFSCILFCVMLYFSITEVNPCIQSFCKKSYYRAYIIIKEVPIYLLAITVIVGYSYMMNLTLNLKDQNSRNCFLGTAQERMNSVYDTLNGTALSLSYCLLINIGIMLIIDFSMSTFQCFKIFYKLKLSRTSKFNDQFNNITNNQQQGQIQNQNQTPKANQQESSNQYCYQTPFMQQENYQNYPNQIQNNYPSQTNNYQFQHNQVPQQYVENQIQETEMIQQKERDENNIINFQED